MRRWLAAILCVALTAIACGQASKPDATKSKQAAKSAEPEVIDLTPVKKPTTPGPFGFEAGMTKEQIIAKLGSKNVKRTSGDDIVSFTTAPIPHPDFNEYALRFAEDGRLIQIIAFTGPISSNDSGDQVKEKFAEISKALHTKYGEAFDVDRLTPGSIWHDPNDWMMGLLKKDRNLESLWATPDQKLPHQLTGIMLEAEALTRSAAVITLTYQFEGFAKWADKQQNKKDSAF
jgi:hypothetical protein